MYVRQEKTTSPHNGYFHALDSNLFQSTRQFFSNVADASKLISTAPTEMGKISHANFVRNNGGATGGQKEDTDQDYCKDHDQMHAHEQLAQHRLFLKDRHNF